MNTERTTRRGIIKKAAYLTPLIFTVAANKFFFARGSGDYHIGPMDKERRIKRKRIRKIKNSDHRLVLLR